MQIKKTLFRKKKKNNNNNGFMATPELGHRMYGYTLLDCIVESQEYIYIYIYIYIGRMKNAA